MNNDHVIAFQSAESSASFSELVRQGALQSITQAVSAELNEFLAPDPSLKDDKGRQAVVRHGYLPERTIVTGVGGLSFRCPK